MYDVNNSIEALIRRARKAAKNAHVPRCGFAVGACIRTIENKCFEGCNLENTSYPLSQCAEASAIGAMVNAGYQRIADIVILAKDHEICPPCGACRQRIFEFSDHNTRVYLCNENNIVKTFVVSQLFPYSSPLER